MSRVPLVVQHEIVNLPSASVLAMLRKESKSQGQKFAKTVAIVADPVFGLDDPRVQTGKEKEVAAMSSFTRGIDVEQDDIARSLSDTEPDPTEILRLPRLLYSRQEADAIVAVTAKGQSYEALDFDANRGTVMSSAVLNSRIMHFATHGFLDSKNPELSGLVFSLVDQKGRPQVGFFGLEDVFNSSLPVDLVVLSACQTALGEEVDGEGLVGLTWGFLYAGAKSVVASLWNVNDASTAELMRLFYDAMERKGMPPVAALRSAQVSMSHDPRWGAPYYWAGFTIDGDWLKIAR